MGILRLFLAALVLQSHLGVHILGLNAGVASVIVFYLLAGHVVSQLWTRRPANVPSPTLWFYQDRLWRILPMYMASLVLAFGLWVCGAQSPFLSASPNGWDWLSNLLIIPLNYVMYTGQSDFMLLPPAWSLGAELQFYLLVPLLMSKPRIAIAAACISLVVFTCAQIGVLDTDIFGYRLLAGVGMIFLAGTLLGKKDRLSQLCLLTLWVASVIYSLWLISHDAHKPFNIEVAVGIALGIPTILLFFRFPRQGFWYRLQRKAGELSYGVFLMHFSVIWLLQLLGLAQANSFVWVFALSTLFAWLAHVLCERPLWAKYRLKLPAAALLTRAHAPKSNQTNAVSNA